MRKLSLVVAGQIELATPIMLAIHLVLICLLASAVGIDSVGSALAAPKKEAAARKESAEDRAINLVRNTKDVKAWLKLFSKPDGTSPATGGRPGFRVDSHTGDTYKIAAVEDMPERQTTFGFYTVNLKTGKVSKEE